MQKKITIQELKEAREVLDFSPLDYKPFIKASPYASYIFANYLPFTPNEISLIWGLIGLFGFFTMAIGGYWFLLIGILIYQFAILLDFVDGDIARATKKTSLVGTYLDKVFHSTHRGILMLVLGVGLYNTFGEINYLYMGVWTCTFLLIDNLSKVKFYEMTIIENKTSPSEKNGKKGYEGNLIKQIKFYLPRFLNPNQPLSILLFVILFNVSQYYLIFMTILTPLFFLKGFINTCKKVGKLSNS